MSTDDSSESEDPDFGRPPITACWPSRQRRLVQVQALRAECVCCKDIAEIRTEQLCVTLDADFEVVCLNTAVLRVAYIDAHVNREYAEIADDHTRYRYTAYRQFTRWTWGYLGQENRRLLPSCAVRRIREQFPSATYRGFRLAPGR
ncbi:hypothetical protein MTO96_030334 [Rhipicephalus appendiculatus]